MSCCSNILTLDTFMFVTVNASYNKLRLFLLLLLLLALKSTVYESHHRRQIYYKYSFLRHCQTEYICFFTSFFYFLFAKTIKKIGKMQKWQTDHNIYAIKRQTNSVYVTAVYGFLTRLPFCLDAYVSDVILMAITRVKKGTIHRTFLFN